MRKLQVIAVVVVVFLIIAAILVRNRAQIQAETRNLHVDSYTVTVAPVEREDVVHSLDLVRTINANNDVRIISQTSGKVTSVQCRVGDYESAKSVLIQVDDKLQDAALKLARVSLEKATKDYDRYKQLYKEN